MFRKIRRWWHRNALLLIGQGLIGFFRLFFRAEELSASPARREKLRRFREKMTEIESEKNEVLGHLDDLTSDDRDKREAALARFDEFSDKYSGNSPTWQESRAWVRAVRAESDALQAIWRDAGDDTEAAIAAFQAYIVEHPESNSAYSYLGGALMNAKEFGAAIEAYKTAERIALAEGGASLISAYSARHSIGLAQLASGDAPAAIATWTQLIADVPESVEYRKAIAYLSIGDAYQQMGDIAAARKAWRQVAQYDETGIMAAEAKKRLAEFR